MERDCTCAKHSVLVFDLRSKSRTFFLQFCQIGKKLYLSCKLLNLRTSCRGPRSQSLWPVRVDSPSRLAPD